MALLKSIFGHWMTSVAGAGIGGTILYHGHDITHVVLAILATVFGLASADGTKTPLPPTT